MANLRNSSAIVGIGATDYTRESGRSVEALALEACRAAVEDAGLERHDVDGVVTFGLADTVSTTVVASGLGLPRLGYALDINGGGNTAASAVIHAAMAVATGQAQCVLVYRALNGASGIRYGGVEFTRLLEQTSVHSDAESQFLSPYGVLMPAHEFALLCGDT